MKLQSLLAFSLFAGSLLLAAEPPVLEYANDFQKTDVGQAPSDLQVLNGNFSVKEEGGNRFLELAGSPLESMGFEAGPANSTHVRGRIRADVTGKRMPEFGVSLRGSAGWRLWVMPAVGQVQLLKNDELITQQPYRWTPGWTWFDLKLQRSGEEWVVDGKVWQDGQDEPAKPVITAKDNKPATGKAILWGVPFSGKPIAFDDIHVDTR